MGRAGLQVGTAARNPSGENSRFGVGREQQEQRHAVSGEKVGDLAHVLLGGLVVAHAGVTGLGWEMLGDLT